MVVGGNGQRRIEVEGILGRSAGQGHPVVGGALRRVAGR